MFVRRKRLFRCYILTFAVWVLILLIIHLSLYDVFSFSFLFGPPLMLDSLQLRQMMLPNSNSTTLADPLALLLSPNGNFYHFYHLPKRKWNVQYGEITSANRDSHYPLGPDFTFHIEYSKQQVTIYEDYGAGCIYRIFVYPPLPTNSEVLHRMTSADLANMFLAIEVDDKAADKYSLKDMMEAVRWPFVNPLSTRHPSPASGIGVYFPVCYEKSMRIVYHHNGEFPDNLFELNINCTANELLCPVHIYSAVSRHKFPTGTPVPFGTDVFKRADNAVNVVDQREIPGPVVAKLLERPESNGPSAGFDCTLTCFELCTKCQRVLFHKIDSSGVIISLRVRVFDLVNRMSRDWNNILLTAYFDEAEDPQIDHVPIGSLFGATASLNEHRGAAFGKRIMYCDYADDSHGQYYSTITGYFYLPMPYWREAMLVIDATEYLKSSVQFCFQVTEVSNNYVESETGHLHALKTYYGDDVGGWRNVIDVQGGWGQFVGLAMEIDNLRPIRGVPLMYRWAALQADSVIYVDGSESATVLGTGLEDYFSYAHGFAGAENTTYSFVGVHHAGPRRTEPLTWHCYRQHILDPITFRDSLRMVMEGTDSQRFMNPAKPLTYSEHRARLMNEQASLAHVALYYFRAHPSTAKSVICDRIEFGQQQSETSHLFQTERASLQSGHIFSVINGRFLGDTARNLTFNASGRSFKAGDAFKFVLNVAAATQDLVKLFVLRRTFLWTPREWNSKCRWTVNGVSRGIWFVPMGSLSDEYSLQTDEVTLLPETGRQQVEIKIEPLSNTWNDVSYELCPVV